MMQRGRTLNSSIDRSRDMQKNLDEQLQQAEAQQAQDRNAARAAARRAYGEYKCPRGFDYDNCTDPEHQSAKAEWRRGLQEKLDEADRLGTSMDSTVNDLRRRKNGLNRTISGIQKDLDNFKRQQQGIIDWSQKFNSGDKWLNPYGGRSPLVNPR